MKILSGNNIDRVQWAEFVKAHPKGNIFQTPQMFDVYQHTPGYAPQVIKEAMACGCPIVSVDVGDVAERTEGVDGCCVVASREPKEIADALEKAIAFEGKTKGCEKIIAEGLTNEQVIRKLINIYEKVKR